MEPVEPLDDDRDATLSGVTAEEDRALAIRLYRDSRLPAQEIAVLVNVSRQTVHNWVKAAGVPLRGTHSGTLSMDDSPDDMPVPEAVADLRVRSVLDAIATVREDLSSGQESLRALTARVAALEALSARLAAVIETAVGLGPTPMSK